MEAAVLDFSIRQGASFLLGFVWMDVTEAPNDISECIVRMQVRPYPGSKKIFLEASTTNERIYFGENPGEFWLDLDPTVTAAIDWRRGKYDIELQYPDGGVIPIIGGTITVTLEVTRNG